MKKILTSLFIVMLFVVSAFSQKQDSNEGFIGGTVGRADVREIADVKSDINYGVTGQYTHYFGDDKAKGKVGGLGVMLDITARFNPEGLESITVAEGVKLAARNSKKVQPWGMALVGISQNRFGNRLEPTPGGGFAIRQRGDATLALIGGAGVDLPFSEGSRFKVRLGAKYMNTQHNIPGKKYQHNVDVFGGIVF